MIAFSAAMVRAILDGRKTQTRRVYRDRPSDFVHDQNGPIFSLPTPYGSPGDRLWVRETWVPASREHCSVADYPADNYWASRIKLEVTAVRVQRLQEIREDDAKAEGVRCAEIGCLGPTYRSSFCTLWDLIYGKRTPWSSNPWVWAITFSRVT